MSSAQKYAVLVSNEHGDRPNFEAVDVPFDVAIAIASANGRVDCSPIGYANRSFVAPDGQGLVWSIVASRKKR